MANARKTNATPARSPKKRATKPAPEPAPNLSTPRWKKLSPDGVKRLWSMHHLDRPEVIGGLERLYRRQY
jgi:hypothetical protein